MIGIYGFKNEHRYLSNMFKCNIIFKQKYSLKQRVYASSEHIYQAYKTTNESDFCRIADLKSPYETKKIIRNLDYDVNFNDYKLTIMKDAVFNKFQQNEDIKKLLLNTGNCHIEETNTWNDTFWGVCNGVGENHLGLILMTVRELLVPVK